MRMMALAGQTEICFVFDEFETEVPLEGASMAEMAEGGSESLEILESRIVSVWR